MSFDLDSPLLEFGAGDPREGQWWSEIWPTLPDCKVFKGDRCRGVIFGWIALCQLANRYSKGTLFRGHSRRHELKPAIGRRKKRKAMSGDELPYSADGERRMLDEFILRSRPHLTQAPTTKLEWMAVARHHSMPTRLLDWSESLLAAAMFACAGSGIEEEAPYNPELCVLSGMPIVRANDPFEGDEVRLYRPPYITSRIPAQQGVFTLHPHPELSLDNHPNLDRWSIISSSAFYIKKKLDVAGINESTIGPDLDGLGKYLGWRYKWGI